uniref:Thioredoxin domain-containing protein 17 n=1 Tax=Cacopsylla melanoneura TaxID=428564 RepID=A0A8D9F087_9HEMI
MSKETLSASNSFKTHFVKGYEALKQITEDLESERLKGSKIFVYFTGEKMSTGESWCPDCVHAEPYVQAYLRKNEPKLKINHLIITDAGNRDQWKDKSNSFRTVLNIQNLPTIIRWKGPQKLTGDELCNDSLLALLFEDAEDYL